MEDSSFSRGSSTEASRIRQDSSDLLEELWSRESDEFLYMIETLMATQADINILNVMDQRRFKDCSSEKEGNDGYALTGKPTEPEITLKERADMAGEQQLQHITKRRFFGIYPRVQLKVAWRRLTKLGVVLRSKRVRLMDIHSNSSLLMKDYERWCLEDARFPPLAAKTCTT